MEPILRETYGVILYQEQVMQIAAAVSGFSLAEADLLRRAMGKKDPVVMAAQRNRFVSGAVELGVAKARGTELFNLIEKFAGYGFNKSHSAAYALVAYQTAYLKAHYPLEFLAAVLNSEINNTTALAKHIMEAREQGIELLPPDINRSDRDFTVEDGKVRYGLSGVKNVGLGAIQEILEARGPGRFESFRDFLERISLNKVNRKVLESLIQGGAFDSLHPRRSRLMAGLEEALEKTQNLKRQQATKQMSMFGGLVESKDDDDWLPEAEPWEKSVKLAREKEALGVYLSGHPLDAYPRPPKSPGQDYHRRPGRGPRRPGSDPGGGGHRPEGKGRAKEAAGWPSCTVEDLSGSIEVLVFSDVYERVAALLRQEPSLPLWVKGHVIQEENGPQARGPGNCPPGDRPAPLAGQAGPASPGRSRDQGAVGPAQRNPQPACRTGAGLSEFPAPRRGSRPGLAAGPEPYPFHPPAGGGQPSARLSGFEPIKRDELLS